MVIGGSEAKEAHMVMISVTLLTRPCPATSSTQFVMKSTIARRSSSSDPYVAETSVTFGLGKL